MLSLENIVSRLQREPRGGLVGVAKATGVPFATLRKLKEGWTTNPRYLTYASLARHYGRR